MQSCDHCGKPTDLDLDWELVWCATCYHSEDGKRLLKETGLAYMCGSPKSCKQAQPFTGSYVEKVKAIPKACPQCGLVHSQ
jgi:hypothetical protein